MPAPPRPARTRPWDIDVDAAAGGPLTPGGATQTVGFTVTNAGIGHQKLNSVPVAVANVDGSLWTAVAGCSAADYSVSVSTAPTYDDVAPGGARTGTATVEMVNAAGDQNACKDAVVPLYCPPRAWPPSPGCRPSRPPRATPSPPRARN